jgi:hypothetical protein
MGIAIVVATVTRNDRTTTGTISMEFNIQGRATAKFRTQNASWYPAVGNPVEIYHQDETTLMFKGTVDEVTRFYPNDDQTPGYVFSDVSCVDLSARLDQRLAGEYEFADTAAGTIITTLATDAALASEGLDFSLVATGPTISRFAINYPTFREMLDALTELCPGYRWTVRPDGKLVFALTTAYSAPFSLTAAKCHAISVRQTREDYFNQVVVRVTNALRETETEEFTGDGSAQTFELPYPAGRVSKVRVNEVEQDLGIGDVDTGKDWYWNAGSATIRQDTGGTPLTGSDTLSVDFQGIESIVVGASDATEQTARATIENNTGKYEVLRESAEYATRTDAQALAQALVDNAADMPEVMRYSTSDYLEPLAKSLQPGQLQAATETGLAVSGNWLVTRVSISTLRQIDDQDDLQWRYDVEAIKGPAVRDYVQFFRGLGGGGGGGAIGGSAAAVANAGIHYVGGADTITLDLANGLTQEILLDRATTEISGATFNGGPVTPGTEFTVIITVDSTAGRLVTWSGGFFGLTFQSIESEPNSVNIYKLMAMRNGTFLRTAVPVIGVI